MESLHWPPSNVDMAINVRKLVKDGAKDAVSCAYIRKYGKIKKPLYVNSVEEVRINDNGGYYDVLFPAWLPEKEQDLIVEECVKRGLSYSVTFAPPSKVREVMWEAMKSKIKPKESFYNDADPILLKQLKKVRVNLLKRSNETEINDDVEKIMKGYKVYYPPQDRRDAIHARVLCLLQFECHIRHTKRPETSLVRIIPDSMLHAYMTRNNYKFDLRRVSTLEELVLCDDGGLYCVALKMSKSVSVDEELEGAIKNECELRCLEFLKAGSPLYLGSLLSSSNVRTMKSILFASRVKEEKEARAEETDYQMLAKMRWPTDDLEERLEVRFVAKNTISSLEVSDKVAHNPSLDYQMAEREKIRLMVSYLEDNKVEVPLDVTSARELRQKDEGGLYLVRYPMSLSHVEKDAIQKLAMWRQLKWEGVP